MTDTPASYYVCGKCRMGFRIQDPDPRAERHVCPDCLLAFWSANDTHSGTVKVGIFASRLAAA